MWGYSIACARVGVKHYVWQQIQIEPSATWHQNVTVEAPYIYHYTFGVEYSIDGIPFVGAVGEWSLDKRHYFGAPPPKNMAEPPMCAEECAWVWWHSFNEATRALGPMWPSQSGGDTRSFRHGAGGGMDSTPIGKALPLVGPWVIDRWRLGLPLPLWRAALESVGQRQVERVRRQVCDHRAMWAAHAHV